MADLVDHQPIRADVRSQDETKRALQGLDTRIRAITAAINPLGDETTVGGLTVTGFVKLTMVDGTTLKLGVVT